MERASFRRGCHILGCFSPTLVRPISNPFPTWPVWTLGLVSSRRLTLLRPLCPSAWLRFWLKFDLKPFSLAMLSRSMINWSVKSHVCPVFFQARLISKNRLEHIRKLRVAEGLGWNPIRGPALATGPWAGTRPPGPGAGPAFGHLLLCCACQQPVLS